MVFSMTGGHPNAPAMMALSIHQGQTTFNFGSMGMLQLGMGQPMVMANMGGTNTGGQAHMQVQVPHHLMHHVQMFGQGFTMMMTMHGPHGHQQPHLAFCTSNVAGFGVGGHHH